MTDPVRSLQVTVRRGEVERYLGYRPGSPRSARTMERLDRIWPIAEGLLRPRGGLRLLERERALPVEMPRPTPLVGLGLATIGSELEDEVRLHTEAGRPLEALLLDAFGSAAADAAADALEEELLAEAARRGLHGSPRISPGYGAWPIQRQQELLALLPTDDLGIRLSPGLMMIPRKTVSFAVRLLDEPCRDGTNRDPCGTCPREDCDYRSAKEDS